MEFQDYHEEEDSPSVNEFESEESKVNLLSITEEGGFFEFAPDRRIGSLTDTQLKSLRDTAAKANDHKRVFDNLFIEGAKPNTDPFRQGPADLAAGKGNPNEIARNNIQKLNEAINKIKGTPAEGRWEHGDLLKSLGEYEIFLGDYSAAATHLKEAVEILHDDFPDNIDAKTRNKTIKEACFNYAIALSRPKGPLGQEDKNKVVEERQIADNYYSEALILSRKLNEAPLEQGTLIREKLLNQTMLAARHDVNTAKGKKMYRDEMLNIINSYNDSLDKFKNDNSNNAIAHRALLSGDLAFVEMSRADKIGDDDAQHSEVHFDEARGLWTQYKPEKNAANKEQITEREISRDRTLVAALGQYWRLLNAQNLNDKAEIIDSQYQAAVDRLAQKGVLN